jgi:helix-turn-helix protein
LIQDYEDIQIETLKDLQSRYSVQEIGERLYMALLNGDNSTFNQITGVLEMELERIYKDQLNKEALDENEDEESKTTPVNEAREYIR